MVKIKDSIPEPREEIKSQIYVANMARPANAIYRSKFSNCGSVSPFYQEICRNFLRSVFQAAFCSRVVDGTCPFMYPDPCGAKCSTTRTRVTTSQDVVSKGKTSRMQSCCNGHGIQASHRYPFPVFWSAIKASKKQKKNKKALETP